MAYQPLTNEQSRQSIDTAQTFKAWRQSASRLWNVQGADLVAAMSWRRDNGKDYLVLRKGRYRKHLGVRAPETEAQFSAYTEERSRALDRIRGTQTRLRQMAPVNRAMGLGRVPNLTADILRALDEHGFLGGQIIVVGTNALYAYEAKAGVHIESPLMETTDADLLWDTRERLTLAIDQLKPPAVLALLRKADQSFDAGRQYGLSAQNRDGFIVELLSVDSGNIENTGLPGDLAVNPMIGMDALLTMPRFEAVVIDRGGSPLRMVVPEVRVFTLLKEWVSKQQSRPPDKRRRDRAQAVVLRQLATRELGLSFEAADLGKVPGYLTEM